MISFLLTASLVAASLVPFNPQVRTVVAAGGGSITWTGLTEGVSTSDPTTTASVTPTANAQVLVAVGLAVSSGDPLTFGDGITVSGNSLTWTEIGTVFVASDRRRLWVFKGTGASPTTEGITINYIGSGTFQEMAYSVD